jgi:hypothetical protein
VGDHVNVPVTLPKPDTGEKLAPGGRPAALMDRVSPSGSEALTTKLCIVTGRTIIAEGTVNKGGWFARGGSTAETRIVARETTFCRVPLLSTVCRVTAYVPVVV